MYRQAGVVLPLFSKRTRRDWGIGQITDLPVCAAWIRRAGQRLLQLLPPHELSAGETSPYGALTAFGLDPIYADVEAVADLDAPFLAETLGEEGHRKLEQLRASPRIDYDGVRALKTRVLGAAFSRFYEREWIRETPRARRLAEFLRREHAWVDDLALYTALRASHGGWGWSTWPGDERDRATATLDRVRGEYERRILEVGYVQWTLLDQWESARSRDGRRSASELDGGSALRRVRRERGRLGARLPISAPSRARRAARRFLGRRSRLGTAALRLARDGGRL